MLNMNLQVLIVFMRLCAEFALNFSHFSSIFATFKQSGIDDTNFDNRMVELFHHVQHSSSVQASVASITKNQHHDDASHPRHHYNNLFRVLKTVETILQNSDHVGYIKENRLEGDFFRFSLLQCHISFNRLEWLDPLTQLLCSIEWVAGRQVSL